jgi:predicted permease
LIVLRQIVYELHHGARRAFANPGFFLAAMLLLAVGIAGATLVFSIVDAVILRTLPAPDPEQLARIVEQRHNRPPVSEYPYAVFDQWRKITRSFSATFAQTDVDVSYADGRNTRPVRAQIVTGNYYSVLGAEPFLGRALTLQDEWASGNELPLIVSDHFWQQEFNRDPKVLGQVVHLAAWPFTVVGVTRPEFNGTSVDSGPDVQVPLIAGKFLTAWGVKRDDPRRCCLWEIAGRLRSGVSQAQAQSETSAAMQAAFESAYSAQKPLSADDRKWIRLQKLRVEPMARGVSWLRVKFSTGLIALMSAALVLLLLACTNVAGMLLARAASQEQQNAIRLAVGASRARLMQHWLAEGAIIAFAGGLAALALVSVCLPFVNRALPPFRDLSTRQLPVALHVSIDYRVFEFALLLCCASTLIAAISPAWHAAHADLLAPLKSANSSRRGTRVRFGLAAAQVAICTLVLSNVGLLVKTLGKLESLDLGFTRDHVITFSVDTGIQKYEPLQTYALASRLLSETRNLPGIASASVAVKPLLRGAGMRVSVTPIGGKRSPPEELNSDSNTVSPGYFETLGMRLLAGRVFNDHDLRDGKPLPVVVNQTFVRTFFPAGSALGQHFDNSGSDHPIASYEIVGIVADSKYRSLREGSFPAVFNCLRKADDFPDAPFQLLVRTVGNPASIISSMDRTLHGIDQNLPFRETHMLSEEVDTSLWAEHTLVRLGLLFSGAVVLLAVVGLYSLLSIVIIEQRKEIGIRMALGAQPIDVVKRTALRTLMLVSAGIGFGLTSSGVSAVLLRDLLFDVSPWNAETQLASAGLVVVCAALAIFWPVMRAVRLDPSSALRDA